ncbi:MAG: YicC family protein [Gemmatimonadota bacterium]|nr:YicC family protein [Gemmatimonadota bacterium]MDH3423749.1 YicC family protein [Gemmatimonadota bacterium]
MIRSMTGYGEAERDSPAGRLRLEVKTVNHRFFNSSIKTPSGFDKYEAQLTAALKRHISRGHVSAYLSIDRGSVETETPFKPDLVRARAYLEALEALRHELNVPGAVQLSMLANEPSLLRLQQADRTEGIEPELLTELAEAAAAAVTELRTAEGQRLAADFVERLRVILEVLVRIEARAPQRLAEQRDRLREQVRELTEQVEVDEDRLAREIAYLAERWDINEELVRFRSHVELFAEALEGDASEPVGKRLGFLVQEMNREANTIASKANDADIAQGAMGLKEEIERIREQVENVE